MNITLKTNVFGVGSTSFSTETLFVESGAHRAVLTTDVEGDNHITLWVGSEKTYCAVWNERHDNTPASMAQAKENGLNARLLFKNHVGIDPETARAHWQLGLLVC